MKKFHRLVAFSPLPVHFSYRTRNDTLLGMGFDCEGVEVVIMAAQHSVSFPATRLPVRHYANVITTIAMLVVIDRIHPKQIQQNLHKEKVI